MNKGSEEVTEPDVGMQQGDWFVAVSLVDLAVTLFTLGVKFYNPVKPYNYQQLGGKRMIRFLFKMESSIEGVESTTSLMKKWTKADHLGETLVTAGSQQELVPSFARPCKERDSSTHHPHSGDSLCLRL